MGVDKASLSIAGQPLWRRQLGLLRELQPQAVWISARTVPTWCPADVETVVDAAPSRGPLSGVAAGLRRLRTSHLLVLAVDLPQMTAAHVRRLWTLARPGVGILPYLGDRLEPLCAIYPAEAAQAAEAALARPDASLRGFARDLLRAARGEVYALEPKEAPLYFNLNTPADLPALSPATALGANAPSGAPARQ